MTPKQYSLEKRIALEKKIVRAVVYQWLSMGLAISVNNGGDNYEIENSKDVRAIMAVARQTDEEIMSAFLPDGKCIWVRFVYGNDGWDVICDYSISAEPYLTEAHKIAEAAQ